MKETIFNLLNMTNYNAIYKKDIVVSYDNFFGFNTKYTGLKSEIEIDSIFLLALFSFY